VVEAAHLGRVKARARARVGVRVRVRVRNRLVEAAHKGLERREVARSQARRELAPVE